MNSTEEKGRKRLRPVHIWWIGVILFAPSFLFWTVSTIVFVSQGRFNCPMDANGITRFYLPFFAALLGLLVPVMCLFRLRTASWKVSTWAFTTYLALMILWGIMDIRSEHHQAGGHGLADTGPGDYFHVYYTWYFLPYRLIERGDAR